MNELVPRIAVMRSDPTIVLLVKLNENCRVVVRGLIET